MARSLVQPGENGKTERLANSLAAQLRKVLQKIPKKATFASARSVDFRWSVLPGQREYKSCWDVKIQMRKSIA